ncbi:MAG: DinB family protein [Flavipsychrobacter sp.]
MQYNLNEAVTILSRTPEVLNSLLKNLPKDWVKNNEGADTWSPYDVVGHMVHGERKDWTERMNIILSDAEDKTFQPFDRFAQLTESKGKSMEILLEDFAILRARNLLLLQEANITDVDLDKKGIHPALGEVTLRQLLSTWVVHDLNHTAQITRVMAKQYKENVGPWQEYLRILK